MAVLLARFDVDAARLWRAHPPRIHHAQKRVLFELAGGTERSPAGQLAISRWAPGGASSVGAMPRTSSVAGPFAYPDPARDTDVWHVNFADTELFAFYGGPAFAQDEIQVAEHPILASVRGLLVDSEPARLPDGLRALARETHRPTPVLVRNVERWCAIDTDPELARPFGIYGQRLSRAKDAALRQAVRRLEGGAPSNVVAMVAPQGQGRYSRGQITDVLETATTAFEAARSESVAGHRLGIATGHWGTGVFGGDRVLMAAAQIVAARSAGVDELVYHSLSDEAEAAYREGLSIAEAIAVGASREEVVDLLHAKGFCWGTSDGN